MLAPAFESLELEAEFLLLPWCSHSGSTKQQLYEAMISLFLFLFLRGTSSPSLELEASSRQPHLSYQVRGRVETNKTITQQTLLSAKKWFWALTQFP